MELISIVDNIEYTLIGILIKRDTKRINFIFI